MGYFERLRVPVWWWFVLTALCGAIAVAVLAYVPWHVGVAIPVLCFLALAAVLFSYGNAAVVVDSQRLRVGRFSIEGRWIARAEALDADESARVSGVGADPRNFMQTRPYIKTLVRVKLADPADPHPHWLVSSRRPVELAAAIGSIAGGAL